MTLIVLNRITICELTFITWIQQFCIALTHPKFIIQHFELVTSEPLKTCQLWKRI